MLKPGLENFEHYFVSVWDECNCVVVWIFFGIKYICHFYLIIIRDLIYIILEWSSGFPYFLQFKSEFCNKKFMIWAIVSSRSCFCWLYRASPSLATKNTVNLILVLTIWWCPCVESSLVLLEEGVCYNQCDVLSASACFILYSKVKLVCYSRYLLASCFYIPVPYNEKNIFFWC